jgi:hypothetical protein
MKTIALLLTAGFLAGGFALQLHAGDAPAKKAPEAAPGSRTYQVALFKRGPQWGRDPGDAKALQNERLQYLARLERDGKIALAGAFTDRGLYHSMIVFRVNSIDEAKGLIAEMPSIKSEKLVYEIHPWLSADGIRVVQPRPGNPAPAPKGPPKKAEPKKEEPKKAEPPK